MNTTATLTPRVSEMAENLIGSEIIKLAGEIRELIAKGEHIYNFTIGDFDPNLFAIPTEFKSAIIKAYENNETNYPAADGNLALRKAVSALIKERQGLTYTENEILIAGGARPIIYAFFQTIADPNDKIVFPVPSWNNNHYTHLSHAQQVYVETRPENNFMPTAEELRDKLKGASILALCSPLNPTGTVFSKEQLQSICELVLAENANRSSDEKPLYVLYDQIYWQLTFGTTVHYDPVGLMEQMRPYTVFVDGMSKAFAATGVRVGWTFGPKHIIEKMKSILGHIGAWSPKAEQVAAAEYLTNKTAVDTYLTEINQKIETRLQGFYQGLQQLKSEGLPVDAISPMAAIYLTVNLNLIGKTQPNGKVINSTEETTAYILREAKLALVPFKAFGSSADSTWYRLSIGTASIEDVNASINNLRIALLKLK